VAVSFHHIEHSTRRSGGPVWEALEYRNRNRIALRRRLPLLPHPPPCAGNGVGGIGGRTFNTISRANGSTACRDVGGAGIPAEVAPQSLPLELTAGRRRTGEGTGTHPPPESPGLDVSYWTPRVKVTVPVNGLLAESAAVTVRTYDPLAAAAGVPEMAPLAESSARPAGSVPDVTA